MSSTNLSVPFKYPTAFLPVTVTEIDRATATLDDGQTVDAWVYFYNAPLGSAPQIESGDYLEHVRIR